MPTHSVADVVTAAATDSPDVLAVVEAGGRSLTYAALDAEVTRVASGLVERGVVAGNRVLLASGNRLELVTSYLGVLRAQAVAVPVNPASAVGELRWMIVDSGALLVVADPVALPAIREALAGAAPPDRPEVVVVDGQPGPFETAYDALGGTRDLPPLLDPERPAALLYTGGTTARPRAAVLTHRALLANLEQVAATEPALVAADDVVLGALPLFHVYGLNAVLGGVLRHRARLVIAERFEPDGTLDLVQAQACTVVPAAPAVFAHWLRVPDLADRLRTVRVAVSGSAPLAREVVRAFVDRTGVPLHQGYGLTEAGPVVTTTLGSTSPADGSLGSPLPGVELRLRDEGGREPEVGDPGQVEIRGDNLFSGYWPHGKGGPGDDGWWATGDIGCLDDAGALFLVDRLAELVVVSGFNVYPQEVEDVIRELPGVREVGVIGVPDPATGQAVVAYVVGDEDPASAPLAAAVRAHCAARLAGFKQPARVDVVDRLPVTAAGRVQKGSLRGIERRRALGLAEEGL